MPAGFGQKQSQGGFAAARRTEQQQTRQTRRVQQGFDTLFEVALPYEVGYVRGAQTFRQGLGNGHDDSRMRPGLRHGIGYVQGGEHIGAAYTVKPAEAQRGRLLSPSCFLSACFILIVQPYILYGIQSVP